MFAAHFFQHINDWFAPVSRSTHQTNAATVPAEQVPAEQLIVQPGDTYFLAAGAYQLRVLTGHLWISEQGILAAGAQRDLRVDWQGVEIRPATARSVVFTVGAQIER